VHGRSILAETVQKVVIENMKAADAAKWGHGAAGVGAQGAHQPRPVMHGNWRDADNRIGVLFILPFVAAALVFMVFPVAEAVRMAFFHVNPLDPDGQRFVGLDNFRTVFADPLFWKSFRNAAGLDRHLDRAADGARGVARRSCCTCRCAASPSSAGCCSSPTSCRRWSSRSAGSGC
jgi:hypothetical protein